MGEEREKRKKAKIKTRRMKWNGMGTAHITYTQSKCIQTFG